MQKKAQDLAGLFIAEGVDWSTKAIHAALHHKGQEFASLEQNHGLKPGSMRNVFYRSCPNYERIIAGAIGVSPSVIWPSRYHDKNTQVAAA